MRPDCYNSYMESDIRVLCDNYKIIQKHIGEGKVVMPILKANAYGFGAVEAAKALIPLGADIVAVAQVSEGIQLREAGIDVPILILGGVPAVNIPYAVEYDLQTIIFTQENAICVNDEAKKQGKIAEVQIKIDSGMHRVGIERGKDLQSLLDLLKTLSNIKVVGAFSHLATADIPYDEFALYQYSEFKKAIEQIKDDKFFELKYIHCHNTPGTAWLKDDICTHYRPGAMILGYCRYVDGTLPMPVKESMSYKTYITAIKEIPVGESVGYSRHFKPTKPSKVATICIGYADGLFRPLAYNGGPVLVNGVRAKYAGICMDQSFIDVTGIDCNVGDEVTVLGYSKNGAFLSAYELADFCDEIYQIFVSDITSRVGHIYKR